MNDTTDIEVLLPVQKHYVAHIDGEIIQTGSCAEHDLASMGAAGSTCIEGEGHPATHHVVDGQIVAYTAVQAQAKATRPNFPARWSNASMGWVDIRTLDDAKAEAVAAVMDAIVAAEDKEARPTRDYIALTLIKSPTAAQTLAKKAEGDRVLAAYTGMLQLRAKLAAVNASTTQQQLDAAIALPTP